MKRILVFCCILVIIFTFSNCKRYNFSGLGYTDISTYDWLQANVVKKSTGEKVCWFQIFDWVNEKSTIETYKKLQTSVGKYPANISDNKWVWIMVNDRIEIRLLADDNSKDFQDTDKLKGFILTFNLDGLSKITGDKVSGQELLKYVPKLDK